MSSPSTPGGCVETPVEPPHHRSHLWWLGQRVVRMFEEREDKSKRREQKDTPVNPDTFLD